MSVGAPKKMAEKVTKAGLKKESGYLYFLDKDGDISRARLSRGRSRSSSKPSKEKAKKLGVKKEPGYLYFIDKQGDVSRAPLKRGR